MGDASGIKAGDSYVAIGADDRGLQRALNNIAGRLRGFGSVVSGIGRGMVGLGASITAPLYAAAVTSANAGAALYDMSRRTGISASALSSLGFAASLTGTDMDTLEGAIRRMQKTISGLDDVHEGTSAKAIEEIGVQAEQLKGLAPDEQFRTIATAIAGISDPTLRAAETMKIFGKSGTAIIPMIQDLAQLEEYAKRMGFVKTNQGAKEAKELSVAFQVAEMALKGLWGAAASGVLPIIKEQTAVMIRATVVVRDWLKEHKEGIATAFKVGLAFTAAGTAFLVVGKAVSIAGSAVSAFGSLFSVARSLIMGSITVIAGLVTSLGSIPIILAAVGGYFLYTSGVGKTVLEALGGYFGDLKDTALEAFGGVRDALSAGDWKLAAEVAWAGLKLAWAQGILPLKTMWQGMKSFAQETWANLGDKIVEYSIRSIAFLKDVWSKFKAWFNNLTTDFGDSMVGAMIDAKEAVGLISGNEAADQRRRLGQVNEAGHNTNNAERDAALDANEKETEAQLASIKQVNEAELDAIERSGKEAIAANQDEVDARKKGLDEVAKKAKAEAEKAKKDRFGALPSVPDLPNGPTGLPPEDLNRVMSQVHAAGTFNPRAIFGLGNNSVAQRQLDTLKEIKGAAGAIAASTASTAEAVRKANSLFP